MFKDNASNGDIHRYTGVGRLSYERQADGRDMSLLSAAGSAAVRGRAGAEVDVVLKRRPFPG